MQRLLQSRADIRKAEVNHREPLLFVACVHAHVEVARILLEAGVDPNADSARTTPLILATMIGNLELMQLLLESGVDCNRASPSGHRPLQSACVDGRLDAARLLLQHNADSTLKCNGVKVQDMALGRSRSPWRRRRMKEPH